MAPSETAIDGRGLSLRQLVLEVRSDVKTLTRAFDDHLLEHANAAGRRQGEARIFGVARSTIATIASLVAIATAVYSLVAH